MLIVIFAVCVATIVVGALLDRRWNTEFIGITLKILGGIALCFTIIASLMLGCELTSLRVYDDKIAMYEEENAQIEQQITEIVSQYQDYEKEIFADVKPESSMTLISLYPELKSDTLVQKQIEVYTANNQKIKELKAGQLEASVYRWWLYFGK